MNKSEHQPGESQSSLPGLKTVEQGSALPGTDSNSNYLAHGWAELIDETTGLSYYFNEQDGVTSWEKPLDKVEELKTSKESSGTLVQSETPVGEPTEVSSPENTGVYHSLDEPSVLEVTLPQPSASPEDAHLAEEEINSTMSNFRSLPLKEAELVPEQESSPNKSDVFASPLGWVESTDPTKRDRISTMKLLGRRLGKSQLRNRLQTSLAMRRVMKSQVVNKMLDS